MTKEELEQPREESDCGMDCVDRWNYTHGKEF